MDNARRNSESPGVGGGGSSWSLPDVKNPIKILSRSMTSDVLLRNVELHGNRSGSPTVTGKTSTSGVDYKEAVEKYIVKTSFDKPRVERQLSDALIVVKSSQQPQHIAKSDSRDRLDLTTSTMMMTIGDNRSRSSSITDEPDFSRASFATPSPRRNHDSKNFYKILESLYLGDKTAAGDRTTLCKLNLHCSVRLNGSADRKNGSENWCSCSNQQQHKTMNLKMDNDSSIPQLINAFKETNQFISSCRTSGNKVLIFESEGMRRAGALVVQYIMHYYRMKYYEAKDFVVKASSDFDVPSNLEHALRVWENETTGTTPSSRPDTPNMEKQHTASRPEASIKSEARKCPKQIAWE